MKIDLKRQFTRRSAVILSYAMFGCLLVIFWGADRWALAKELIMAMLLLSGAGIVAGFAGLSHITRDYAMDHSGQNADERQLAVRDAAYRSAYLWFAGMVMVGIGYANLATSKRLGPYLWLPESDGDWRVIGGLVMFLGGSLPHAIVAWREPDLPDDPVGDAIAVHAGEGR